MSEAVVCSIARSSYVAQIRFAYLYHIGIFRQSQAPTVLTLFIDVSPITEHEEEKEYRQKVTRRTLRLEARVTKQEYTQAAELAKTCGLSMSDYVRRTALGQHPRQRLSEREVEALCSLTDARGDLIRIAAAVKSIQADKRAMYFSDTRFVEQWMRAATQLINRWSQIENYLTE